MVFLVTNSIWTKWKETLFKIYGLMIWRNYQ